MPKFVVEYYSYYEDAGDWINADFAIEYESAEKLLSDLLAAGATAKKAAKEADAAYDAWKAKRERMLDTGPEPDRSSGKFEFGKGKLYTESFVDFEGGDRYRMPKIITLDEWFEKNRIDKR